MAPALFRMMQEIARSGVQLAQLSFGWVKNFPADFPQVQLLDEYSSGAPNKWLDSATMVEVTCRSEVRSTVSPPLHRQTT
jgi:hypothetical protein